MVSKNAPTRMQSGGTRVTRRTVARGVAWSAPVAAVGVATPAFAVSPCTPTLTLSGDSCKCPGQSEIDQPWAYFLRFCITDANACPETLGAAFTVTKVVSNSNIDLLPGPPPNCGYAGLPVSGTVGSGGCTVFVRLLSSNSAHFLDVTFNVAGGPSQTVRLPAPPDCANVPGQETKCQECT
jgi:hypothetical protein